MKPNESPSGRRHHRLAAHSGLPGLARPRRVRLPDRHRGTLCLRRPGHRTVSAGGALVLGTFSEDGPNHCSGLPTPATPPASWPKCSRPASLSSTACGKPIGPRQASSSRSRGSSSAAPKRSTVVGLQRSELESLGLGAARGMHLRCPSENYLNVRLCCWACGRRLLPRPWSCRRPADRYAGYETLTGPIGRTGEHTSSRLRCSACRWCRQSRCSRITPGP